LSTLSGVMYGNSLLIRPHCAMVPARSLGHTEHTVMHLPLLTIAKLSQTGKWDVIISWNINMRTKLKHIVHRRGSARYMQQAVSNEAVEREKGICRKRERDACYWSSQISCDMNLFSCSLHAGG